MIFILDKSMRVCDVLSNNGENSHITPFFDDIYASYLDTGAETYQFSTLADTNVSQHLVVGNHIAFQYENEHKLFTITEITETHDENFIKTVYCEMAGLKLINKIIRPMSLKNVNLTKFVETLIEDTEWEIGDIDTSLNKTCDIEITDYTNAYSLLSTYVKENYEGEVHFTTKIDGKLATKKINVYAKRGTEKGFRFSYDSNLTSITRTVNLDDLVTALIGVGNNDITFKDVEATDKPLNQDYIADEEAYLLWSDNGEHILGYEKFDTDSPLELLALTRKKLKERKEPKIRYELKPELLGESVRVGDTVYVVDNEFNPPIYLNARVNELTISLTDSSSNTCVLSNFVEVNSNITDEMKQMGSQLEDYVDSKFPIGTDDIEDGAITEDKLHNGEIIQETHIYADSIDTKHLKAESITTKHLKADIIETGHLKADVITSDKIQANSIETKHLKAEIINAGHINSDSIISKHIQANTIDTHHLKANTIQSGHIQSNSIDTNHLKANIINASHIQAGSITSGSGIIGDGAIGNAQISSLDAAKIKSGTIDTSKVTVQGANGHLRLKGNRMQVFDGTGNQAKERVSVGDVNGDGTVYGLRVRGKDGNTILLDENGVTREGITDGSITNDKISDNAEIDGTKLNINSVINTINEDGTEVIKGTKIEVEGTNLDVVLSEINIKQDENAENISQAQSQITANTNAIKLKVDEQIYNSDKTEMTSKLEKNTSEISAIKGQIALKVEQTDIENAKSEIEGVIDSKLDTAKAEIKVTTDAISQNVTNLSQTVSNKADGSTVTTLSNKVGSLETSVNGISGKVSSLETTTTTLGGQVSNAQNSANSANSKIDNLEIGGRNLLKNTALTTNTSSWSLGTGVSRDTSKVLDGRYSFKSTQNGHTSDVWQGIYQTYSPAKEGDKFTASIYTLSDNVSGFDNGARMEIRYYNSSGTRITQASGNIKPTSNNTWIHFTLTGTCPANTVRVEFVAYVTRNGTLWFNGMQLEKGTKATTWTPAPEDVDSAISAVDGKVTNLQGEVNTVKSNVASLEVTTSGISQKVSSVESTTTTLTNKVNTAQSTADSVNNKLNNLTIGGRNYIKDSKSVYMKPNGTSNYDLTFSICDSFWENENRFGMITLSFDVKPDSALAEDFSSNVWFRAEPWYSFGQWTYPKGSTEKKHYVLQTNLKNIGASYKATQLFVRFQAKDTIGMTFTNVKMEIGTKPTDWTPAPEDVQSQIDTHTTQITTTNNKVSSIETNLNSITSRVSATETTTSSLTSQMNNKENKNDRVIYAKGNGNDAPNNSQVKVGSNTLVNGHGRGLNILALNPITLEQYYNGRFDTYGGDNYRTQFAEKIQELNNGNYIIVVTSHDSACLNYATVCDALYLIGGSAPSTSIASYREAYALIGKSKLGKGNGLEMYIPKTATDARVAEVSVKVSDQGALLGVNSNNSESKIDTLTTRVSSAESKLTKDSLTTTIGNHYTTSNDVNGIVTSKGYATTSEVKQTTDALTAKFSSSGGYNLLRNSGFKQDGLHWDVQSYNSPTGGIISYLTHTAQWGFPNANVKCCQIRLSNQSSKEYGIKQTISTTIGKKYTVSFYYASHRISQANMIIRKPDGTWLTNKSFNPSAYDGGSSSISTWGLFSHTFTASSTSHALNIVINNAGDDGYMWVAQPLIEEGELYTSYSPNPSEIYDGITTIDKDGVTVTASNVKSKTNMSANGFKITKTDTNEDVFKVNSDGTLYMKGQITVTGGSIPTSNLSGTISSNQLNSSITSDINNAKNNASNALNTANSVNSTVNSNKDNWSNAYNRVKEWASGAVTGTTNINGGMIATDTITAKQMAIGDFNNYSQLAKGKNLVNRYGTANWIEGTNGHSYWQTTNEYFPFTVNETLNPFKAGDKIQIKFDAYTPSTRNVRVGVWFYSDTAASAWIGDVTANVSCSSSWGTKTVNLTLPTGDTYVQNAKSIAILINNGSSGERIEVRNATVNRLVAGDLIVNGTITTDHIHTNGLNANVIKAGTISADRLDANTIVSKVNGGTTEINGNRIQTGTLSASKITTGTLDASEVNVTNLNASNITSGTISGNRISSNSITADKIAAGAITVDRLSSNNENPIIKLFDNCSIDATSKNEQGKGNAIRLKMDNENYIKVTQSGYTDKGDYVGAHTAIFSSLYPNHEVMMFQGNQHWGKIWTTQGIISTHGDNVYYGRNGNTNDARLVKATEVDSVSTTANNALSKANSAYNLADGKANSSHSHSGETWGTLKMGNLYTNYLNYKDGSTMNWAIVSTAHLAPNATNIWLGSANHNRWGGCFLVNSPNVSSDARLKENIQYLEDNEINTAESEEKGKGALTQAKLYDFIKNDFKLAEYDYIVDETSLASEDEEYIEDIRKMNNHKIGFIAQDIVDTEVGSQIITQSTADGMLGYDTGNLTAVIAGALKEEIKRREELEAKCVDLEERLIKLEKILESKL